MITIVQVRGHAPVRLLLIHDVVQDNMGLNQTNGSESDPLYFRTPFEPGKDLTDASKSPRGVRGFKLNDGTFGIWKVQGKIGGYTKWVTVSLSLEILSILLRVVSPTPRVEC